MLNQNSPFKKMKCFLFLLPLCWLSIHCAQESESLEWETFKQTYSKTYLNKNEEHFRKQIFLKNLQLIEEHNKKYEENRVTYTVNINPFADRTLQEIFPSQKVIHKPQLKTTKSVPKIDVPESIDWRDYGVITPIADQGGCNSCWAFAVVAAIEAHVGIYQGRTNVSLSQQNLMDCVYPAFSCYEEMESHALELCYQYIIENGIDTADSYPYQQASGFGCRYDNNTVGAKIIDYVNIAEGDEEELKTVVGTVGPVSVIITTDWSFSLYQGDVYYKEDCNNTPEPYNHAVTVIGYGNDNGQDYWLVKNEWGEWFGDNGYIKMARNRDNNCGIATYASYPLVEKNL